ncbi:hypothetical protein GCM10010339_42460 [Streptomyces alanosinicus]|uniref:Uncharacterized protein n=1 Tax=Streptomyces alanosinicus TaxID=68171 RepID=A0A918YJU0_9ACTN|nr:hypothetical protein GCM10010339_42460 [Streptomyces alanosinicus]
MKFLIHTFIANSCAVEPEAATLAALPQETAVPVPAGEAAGDEGPAGRELPPEPQAVSRRAPDTSAAPTAGPRSPFFG